MVRLLIATLAALLICFSEAFVPLPMTPKAKCTALAMANDKTPQTTAASLLAAAFFASQVFTSVPSAVGATESLPKWEDSTQVLVAGRMGGRMGGRSSFGGGGMRSYGGGSMGRSYSMPRTSYRSSTTIVRPMIAPPPVVISPFGGGFGYNPGFGAFFHGYNIVASHHLIYVVL